MRDCAISSISECTYCFHKGWLQLSAGVEGDSTQDTILGEIRHDTPTSFEIGAVPVEPGTPLKKGTSRFLREVRVFHPSLHIVGRCDHLAVNGGHPSRLTVIEKKPVKYEVNGHPYPDHVVQPTLYVICLEYMISSPRRIRSYDLRAPVLKELRQTSGRLKEVRQIFSDPQKVEEFRQIWADEFQVSALEELKLSLGATDVRCEGFELWDQEGNECAGRFSIDKTLIPDTPSWQYIEDKLGIPLVGRSLRDGVVSFAGFVVSNIEALRGRYRGGTCRGCKMALKCRGYHT